MQAMEELIAAIQAHSGLTLESLKEAGEYGADTGWAGFTYTSDAAEFTRQHRDLIWNLLSDEAQSIGAPNVAAHIGSFVRADMTDTPEGFDCLLAWWAIETAGRYLAEHELDQSS